MEDRLQEEQHLAHCVQIIDENIQEFLKKTDLMGEKIKEMYDNYRSDNPELHNELVIEISMKAQVDEALKKNYKALERPYFGRIQYLDKEEQNNYDLYIGKNGVVRDGMNLIVIDWRAPVSSIYYECQVGDGNYHVPEQQDRQVRLDLKRTYEIEKSKLIDYYDSEVITNDELLTKYLAKNKEAVLGEIIATIQKEQNAIIRETPFRNVIVQGVAGSGKTTVAMHRISYILYNYGEKFRAEEFYIIGSNQMLLNYITGVLPDLDVYHVNQMILEEFFSLLLEEDLAAKSHMRKISEISDETERKVLKKKGSYSWFLELKRFITEYEEKEIPIKSVFYQEKELYSAEAIRQFLDNNSGFSTQMKINMLNKRIVNKVKMENERKEEKREVIREEAKKYRTYFGARNWKKNLSDIYEEFLEMMILFHPEYKEGLIKLMKHIEKKEYDVYDLAALTWMKRKFKMMEDIEYVKHVVVDEAQDFGVFVFAVMKELLPKATFTVMGDVSQNIHYDSGMNDWEDLKTEVFSPERDKFYLLAKSYRNTVEISQFAERILAKCSFPTYEIQPIIRHGKKPQIHLCKMHRDSFAQSEMLLKSIEQIQEWQQKGYETIAVICADDEETIQVKEQIGSRFEVADTMKENAIFSQGVMILPIYLTKGLEFDAVLLWNPTKERYPVTDANAKLLYVACTRALHELTIVQEGKLSELFS